MGEGLMTVRWSQLFYSLPGHSDTLEPDRLCERVTFTGLGSTKPACVCGSKDACV